jgi:AraC-like DNA-binding protein
MKPGERRRLRISLAELRPVAEAAARAGTHVPSALADAGLDPDFRQRADSTLIDLSAYFRFLEYAGQAVQDETLGVSRRSLLPGSTHFVLSHLPKKSTLFDAMREIAQAYNFLHGGSFNHVEIQDNRLSYIIDDSNFPYVPGTDANFRQFTMECVLIFLHSILVLIASDALDAKLRKVHLVRARKPALCTYLDYWQVPVRFGARRYAVIYDASAAELAIDVSPENIPARSGFRIIADLIERRETGKTSNARIRERVGAIVESGTTSQEEVAKKMGLSVASLRRRLDDEGINFRDLCRDKMNDRAKYLLSRGLSVQEVAESLGFSDFRSFTRAFKSWNRMTPSGYLSSR